MNNDQIILDRVLEQERERRASAISQHEFFEMFVAEQVLKNFDLSGEEIESGIVGTGGDGGIDGIYFFANGELMREDFDTDPLKKNVILDVAIIHAKTTAGFSEDSILKLEAVTRDLFDLSRPVDDFKQVYNDEVRSAIGNFRQIFQALATCPP